MSLVDKSPVHDNPPPYQEVEDEFGNDSPATIKRRLSQLSSTSIFAPPPSAPIESRSATSSHPEGNDYQNNFFQKPPKFLLHSSNEENPPGEFDKVESKDTFKGGNAFLVTGETGNGQGSSGTTSVFTVPAGSLAPGPGVPETFPNRQQPVGVGMPRRDLMFDEHMPRHPHRILCPYCRTGVNTRIEYVNGTMTHLAAIAACWFTCLFCIPYFIRELKDVEHYCPECGKMLGCNRKMDC